MLNKIKYLSFLFVFLFTGCFFITENPSGGNTPLGGNTDSEQDKIVITVQNDWNNKIELYSDPERDSEYLVAVVEANQTIPLSVIKPTNTDEVLFYVVYHLDVGVDCLWYNNDSFVFTGIKNNNNPKIIISEPKNTTTSNSIIVLENKTDTPINLKRGNSESGYVLLTPMGAKSTDINVNEAAGFDISKYSALNNNYSILIKSTSIKISDIINTLEKGLVYTIEVEKNNQNYTAVLKAVTPFDLDTQKKIWSKDESFFDTAFNIKMKRSNNNSTIIMGTPKIDNTKVGFQLVDEYGNFTYKDSNFITVAKNVKKSQIVDFVEVENQCFCMLVEIEYTNETQNYMLLIYDFGNKKLITEKAVVFPPNYIFRKDSQNKLVKISNEKFALVGVYDESTENEFIRYKDVVTIVDFTDKENPIDCTKLTVSYDDMFYDAESKKYSKGTERCFSSAYYDGNDLYICGWENWSPSDYSTTHLGKIYKINVDNFENSQLEDVYSAENCLFFSIEGIGSNFTVCGEYADAGKILKGCFVTSEMIKKDSAVKPIYTTLSKRLYCWFNQLCFYNDKIVLCGLGSDSMDGSQNPMPFVMAYDKNGNKLWENLSYSKYENALNILPNSIGTYLLQLTDKNKTIYYVNADLLGNELVK